MHALLLLAQAAPKMPDLQVQMDVPPAVRYAYIAMYVVTAIGLWKMFEKAGKPGWAGIIPIYNFVVLLQIAGKPIWWILPIILCPCIGLIPWFFLCSSTAKSFGQGTGFAIGLFILFPIFALILGFGDSKYLGPAG